MDVARVCDDQGSPFGYRLLTGIALLNLEDRVVFERLQDPFRFKDVHTAMGGTSDSNAMRFLKRCLALQVILKEGKTYRKVVPGVERVEKME
jgi:hypothetical protein